LYNEIGFQDGDRMDILLNPNITYLLLVLEIGLVRVRGELWSARSDRAVGAGSPVRVVGREGFILVIENIDPSK